MMKPYLTKVLAGENLERQEAQTAMQVIMSGQATEAQIGAFLTALRCKGETAEEIAGFAAAMRECAAAIAPKAKRRMDVVGTGGDMKGTFNISTTVSFVLAAAGITVVKHGNRAVSSACGSADVLTAMGVRIDLAPSQMENIIDDIGIGFLFAPVFHQAMKHAAGPRRELGFRTVFNVLGPLTNPAKANYQVLGVYEAGLLPKMAQALQVLGVDRAMVVHSDDGMDEFSVNAPTQVAEVREGKILQYTVDPRDYGLQGGDLTPYCGGDGARNAVIIEEILAGKPGPQRETVLINAAAGLLVAGEVADLAEGIKKAAELIDSGAAAAKLAAFRQRTQQAGEMKSC